MAQAKKKRRSKHRGTQGGRIDNRPRGRPANRAEARQRAKQRRSGGGGRTRQAASGPGGRPLTPPSWRSAFLKALFASVLLFVVFTFLLGRPSGANAALAVFMLALYTPMAFYLDRWVYSRRLGQLAKEREGD